MTYIVLSSKVKSLIADVQDRATVSIEQELVVPPDYGHVDLTVGRQDLQPVLLLLPNLDDHLGPVVRIVGKNAEWIARTA